jgi:hypothetical protein
MKPALTLSFVWLMIKAPVHFPAHESEINSARMEGAVRLQILTPFRETTF